MPSLDETILVEMEVGKSVDYTVKSIALEGVLSIHEHTDPSSGEVLCVYRMTEAEVVPPSPFFRD
jgi:hypothetical protein